MPAWYEVPMLRRRGRSAVWQIQEWVLIGRLWPAFGQSGQAVVLDLDTARRREPLGS
jgi:hypothetical protein